MATFASGLYSNYLAISSKDPQTLYFCSDVQKFFVGAVDYTSAVRVVAARPATPAVDVLYYNTTSGIAEVFNGSTWVPITKVTINAIGAAPTNDEIATAKAVKDYVDAKMEVISDVIGGDGLVVDVEAGMSPGTLKVTYGDDSDSEVTLTGVAHGVTYNSSTLVLTIPMVGGSPLVVNLPKDNFVESGEYDPLTEEIVLTLKDESEVRFAASDLIDIYTSGSGTNDTIQISVNSDNEISATFKIDTTTVLGIAADGKLTIDLSDIEGDIEDLDERIEDLETALTWGTF